LANPVVASMAPAALQFYNTLAGEQAQAFQGNQSALQAVQSAWSPVLSGGSIPSGYSPALDALLNSNAIQEGGAATANAENAAALRQQQESGGAQVLPSGAQEQINADIAATAHKKPLRP
jgi:hypothetical protein